MFVEISLINWVLYVEINQIKYFFQNSKKLEIYMIDNKVFVSEKETATELALKIKKLKNNEIS